jgi:hypothetical protein
MAEGPEAADLDPEEAVASVDAMTLKTISPSISRRRQIIHIVSIIVLNINEKKRLEARIWHFIQKSS